MVEYIISHKEIRMSPQILEAYIVIGDIQQKKMWNQLHARQMVFGDHLLFVKKVNHIIINLSTLNSSFEFSGMKINYILTLKLVCCLISLVEMELAKHVSSPINIVLLCYHRNNADPVASSVKVRFPGLFQRLFTTTFRGEPAQVISLNLNLDNLHCS